MPEQAEFVDIAAAADLPPDSHKIVKHGNKQILLLRRGDQLFACNNRCPHEGYPLSEGNIDGECRLTCNWHNWKFRLADGHNITGGDHLRTYPIHETEGRIWLDVIDPPPEAQREKARQNLRQAIGRHEYDRIAREIARFIKAGGSAQELVAAAFRWTHSQFEFGATHALGAAPDWLALSEEMASDPAKALAPIVEIIGNLSWDTLREPQFPFTEKTLPWDEQSFLAAIEAEDENRAVALTMGAIQHGSSYQELAPAFCKAALAHYNAFGHGAIYVIKTGRLLRQLENNGAAEILKSLVRMLITSRREDLIPEFRSYKETLEIARKNGQKVPDVATFKGRSAKQAMVIAAEGTGKPLQTHAILLQVAAQQMLQFDLSFQENTHNNVADNVGWLDFSHAITFASATRQICQNIPELWPEALLQLACFVGRNQAYVNDELPTDEWRVEDPAAFYQDTRQGLVDHGQFEYIVAVHLIKTLNAAAEEVLANPEAAYVPVVTAALNRFLNSPLKRRHAERTARQALDFVARED